MLLDFIFNILALLVSGCILIPPYLVQCLLVLIQAVIELGVLLVNTLKAKPTAHNSPPPFVGLKPTRYRAIPCVEWPPKRFN